ncbi:MAG: uracil-DNA glycosylase family protein [Fidelibacterota bacterium]
MNDGLADVRSRILVCTKCPLSQSRHRAVPGEGDPEAEVVFVGQGPGENEDSWGRPFVGRAGDLLNKFFEEVGLRRNRVWITNVTRCLPPNGRLPLVPEIRTCAPYLLEEINVIRPKIVSPLGNIALHLFMGSSAKIQEVCGTPIAQQRYFLFPMMHPAAVLRRQDLLPRARADFSRLKEFLDSNPVLEPPPGQETLF